MRVGFFLETLWQDARCGARSLMKSRGLAAAAVVSLALGIGLNGAIFSAVHAVLLRPLPYHEPDRIVYVAQTQKGMGRDGEPSGLSPADYLDWRERNGVFERMAVYDRINTRQSLSTESWGEAVSGYHISADFFTVLGVQPLLGRAFIPEDDRPDSDVVILGHSLWNRKFGSDPNILGKQVKVNGRSMQVIGVMDEELRYYHFTESPDIELWLPYAFQHNPPQNRQYYLNSAIARLKPGISVEQAKAAMDALGEQLEREHPKENKDKGVWLGLLSDFISLNSRSSVLMAFSAMGLVLLIACANVANLLLVRTEARRHEMAVRLSIGAGRSRIFRQIMTESLFLGLTGGLVGLVVAALGVQTLDLILPRAKEIHRLPESGIDVAVLGFVFLLSIAVGLVCGLPAAFRGSRTMVAGAIQESTRVQSDTRAGLRTRGVLVVLQVALSMVLLLGAGLMVFSMWKLHQIQLGFTPENLLTFKATLPVGEPYASDLGFRQLFPGQPTQQRVWELTPRAAQFHERLVEQLQSIPGVEAASVASGAPMIRSMGSTFQIAGRPAPSRSEAGTMQGPSWSVTPGYFRAMGTKLLQGRDFTWSDNASSPRVVIINQAMAQKYWPGRSPVGQSLMLSVGRTRQPFEIIGVAETVRAWAKQQPGPQMYTPMSQAMGESYAHNSMRFRLWFYCSVRSRLEPALLASSMRQAVEEVEKGIPIEKMLTMDQVMDEEFGPWRSTMMLMSFTGLLSLALAAIGIYGVISYVAAQRTNEVGIRIAFGAKTRHVIWLVMRGGMLLMGGGVAAGFVASYWLVRYISSQLFGVKPMEPAAIAAAAVIMLLAGLLACYLPARRASRMDPLAALRWE